MKSPISASERDPEGGAVQEARKMPQAFFGIPEHSSQQRSEMPYPSVFTKLAASMISGVSQWQTKKRELRTRGLH